MIDLSQKSCVVLDHGLFLEVAHRLSRDFGRVYYVDPSHEEAMAKIDHAVIGDGFPNIERVEEIWDVVDKVDICVFPDVHHGGMQEHLDKMGMPVWGGRRACDLEIKKVMFRMLQQKLGMNTPEFDVIKGLDALREFCQNPEHDDRWIKVSPQFRGNRETFHHANYLASREILDQMGVDFGIVQDVLKFLAEKSIDAPFESGVDSYCVDGQHPSHVLQAYEIKDKCCFGAALEYAKLPQELISISDEIWPMLQEYGARQFCSTEVKITEDKKPYLLEPTIRMASPAGEPQLELYENFSEIIYEGAHGRLVEPVLTGQFYAQAMIKHSDEDRRFSWRALKIPDSVRQWVKLYLACGVGDHVGIAPGEMCLGSVIGIGATPKEALDQLKAHAEEIGDQPVCVNLESLVEAVEQIEEAQANGIPFTAKKMPKPEEVLELA